MEKNITKFNIFILKMIKIYGMLIRGLEPLVILWLLAQTPHHGYGLILEFKKLTGKKLKPSVIYPFLHRLEREGFAFCKVSRKGGRKVKYYSLTNKGMRLFKRVRDKFNKSFREVILELVR